MTGVMLHNVNKIYPNGMQVLHDINLDIKDGEFMVIVGPLAAQNQRCCA